VIFSLQHIFHLFMQSLAAILLSSVESEAITCTLFVRIWGHYNKPYLQPLGLITVSRRPGIDLPLFIQSCFPRLPGEHVHVKSSEDAGGCDLVVLNMARLHAHWLWTPWRIQRHVISSQTILHQKSTSMLEQANVCRLVLWSAILVIVLASNAGKLPFMYCLAPNKKIKSNRQTMPLPWL